MDPNKVKTAVWIGAIGGVATIAALALPWLVDNSQQPGLLVNGLTAAPFALLFAIVMVPASVFLLDQTYPGRPSRSWGRSASPCSPTWFRS